MGSETQIPKNTITYGSCVKLTAEQIKEQTNKNGKLVLDTQKGETFIFEAGALKEAGVVNIKLKGDGNAVFEGEYALGKLKAAGVDVDAKGLTTDKTVASHSRVQVGSMNRGRVNGNKYSAKCTSQWAPGVSDIGDIKGGALFVGKGEEQTMLHNDMDETRQSYKTRKTVETVATVAAFAAPLATGFGALATTTALTPTSHFVIGGGMTALGETMGLPLATDDISGKTIKYRAKDNNGVSLQEMRKAFKTE